VKVRIKQKIEQDRKFTLKLLIIPGLICLFSSVLNRNRPLKVIHNILGAVK